MEDKSGYAFWYGIGFASLLFVPMLWAEISEKNDIQESLYASISSEESLEVCVNNMKQEIDRMSSALKTTYDYSSNAILPYSPDYSEMEEALDEISMETSGFSGTVYMDSCDN